MHNPTLICFGEVLWDLLPSGKIAGGAPMNVAFHAKQLGLHSLMISRVGADELGQQLLDFLRKKDIPTDLIQTDHTFETGQVNVVFDETNSPHYEILQPSAWDFIHPENKLTDTVKEADAVVFGTLACRNERSKRTLFELLDVAPIRILDVNLRPPFFTQNLLGELLPKTDILKLSEEELTLIAGFWSKFEDFQGQMEFLKNHFKLETVLVTKGRKGAVCLDENGFYHQSGFVVEKQDSIGCGDATLAGFVSQVLTGKNVEESLRFACAVGALVATRQGGTPEFTKADVEAILQNKEMITH